MGSYTSWKPFRQRLSDPQRCPRRPASTSIYPSRPDPTTSDTAGHFSAAQKKAVIACANIGFVVLAFIAFIIWIIIRSMIENRAVSSARSPPVISHSRTSTPSRNSNLGRTSTPSRNSKLGSYQSCNTPVILRSILMNPSPRSTTTTPPSNPESREPAGPIPSTPYPGPIVHDPHTGIGRSFLTARRRDPRRSPNVC